MFENKFFQIPILLFQFLLSFFFIRKDKLAKVIPEIIFKNKNLSL